MMKLSAFVVSLGATVAFAATVVQPPQAHVAPVNPCPHPVVIHLKTGLLSQNLRLILKSHGWNHFVWNVPNDYQWIGDIGIQACTLQQAIYQVVQAYPLTVTFYQLNHVVSFSPRSSS